MSEYKIKKTVLAFGSTESTSLTTAETNATVGFGCQIENVVMPKETRSETTEPARLCPTSDSIVKKDTGDIELSELSVTGVADKGDTGYDAAATLLDTMFDNDTKGTILMTHPDGTTKKWANAKVLEFSDDPDGGAEDKIKFTLRMQMHTRLSTS